MTKDEMQRVISDHERKIKNLTNMNRILRKLVLELSKQPKPKDEGDKRVVH